jgi:hypothetical protein
MSANRGASDHCSKNRRERSGLPSTRPRNDGDPTSSPENDHDPDQHSNEEREQNDDTNIEIGPAAEFAVERPRFHEGRRVMSAGRRATMDFAAVLIARASR